jgi:hypothetical protein
MRLLLTLTAQVLFAEFTVMAVVGPLGYAMDGRRGLSWTAAGAAVWSLVFALAALWLKRSVIGWGLAGGLICGAAWAFGYVIGELLVTLTYQSYNFGWAALFGAFGGLGAGLMAGAATAVVPDPAFRRAVRLGGSAAAVCWGGLPAGLMPVRVEVGSAAQGLVWGMTGVVFGLAVMPAGWAVGKSLSPVVVFFEELGPYLAEMARPLAAFAFGFVTLTVVFGGLYGTIWRLNPGGSFRNLPTRPTIWDFAEFSLMTATTGNTPVQAASGPSRTLAGVETILGTGWLIVVFGALSVHLAPRLEQIATRMHRRPSDQTNPTALEQPDAPNTGVKWNLSCKRLEASISSG